MDKKYDEVMEHIEVTPEMQQRILGNIQKMDLNEIKSARVIQISLWKQFAALAACLAVVLAGALTLPNLIRSPNDFNVLTPGGGIVKVVSAEELTKAMGFDVDDLKQLPFQIGETTYTAYWKDLAEIEYSGEGRTAVYRKGPGKKDVSGDYNPYAVETRLTVSGLTVTLKGNGEGYALAIWTDGAFSYSLYLSEELLETEWREILIANT